MSRYCYGLADEAYVREEKPKRKVVPPALSSYKYRTSYMTKQRAYYDHHAVPIVFRATPDSLLYLTSLVLDAIPIEPVFKWTTMDVCKWLRSYGYPHFQNTFKENYINGRTLLLLDADALQAMNIKNFADIKRLTYGIRCLFVFDMTKFARSISLPSQYYMELYKLFRVKSGLIYENVKRTDLWRRMQLVREKNPNYSHWEILERWIARIKDPKYDELFGGARRRRLYRCKKQPIVIPTVKYVPCNCMPPCECFWTEKDYRRPWRLKCLQDADMEKKTLDKIESKPIAIETWDDLDSVEILPQDPLSSKTLTCLSQTLPQRYTCGFKNVTSFTFQLVRLAYFQKLLKPPKERARFTTHRSVRKEKGSYFVR